MINRTFSLFAFATVLAAGAVGATPVTDSFDVNFQTSQSLWAGGPSGGFDTGRQTFGLSFAGAYYDVIANSGTVNSSVNGSLQASYDNLVTVGSTNLVSLSYLGGASSVDSAFGASAEAGVYYDINLPFPLPDVSGDFDLVDVGFSIEPSANFTSNLDVPRFASGIDELAGVGSFDPCFGVFGGCDFGASINLDIAQTIGFTPTGVTGLILYESQSTGEMGVAPFAIADSGSLALDFSHLTAGIWDFILTDVSLDNEFSNDIDLEIRPQLDYFIGSWSPGSLPIGLIEETFSLDFGTIATLGSFSITVAPIPVPAAIWLLGSALLGLGIIRRRAV